MEAKIYLSGKKVYLKTEGRELKTSDLTPDKVAAWLMGVLIYPSRIVDVDGSETVSPQLGSQGFSINVSAFGGLRLENGRLGSVLSVSRPGIVGMFFYKEGDDFMTEIVDPDVDKPAETVEGEEVDSF